MEYLYKRNPWSYPYPNWVGDHYEQLDGRWITALLPNRGFYFWFYSEIEECDIDAIMLMGNEL